MKWRFRLAARTHASHAWNTGSIPVGATKRDTFEYLFFVYICRVGIKNSLASRQTIFYTFIFRLKNVVCANVQTALTIAFVKGFAILNRDYKIVVHNQLQAHACANVNIIIVLARV